MSEYISPKEKEAKLRKMTVSSSSNIRELLQAIDRGALGSALLKDSGTGRFAGLVTDGDVRRALLKGLTLDSSICEIERPETRTATADMSLDEIYSMFRSPVNLVPIIDDGHNVVDVAKFDDRIYLPVAEPHFGQAELRNVTKCILSGWVSSSGEYVTEFEKLFGEFCGSKYAIATSSGTSALHLSLLAVGVGVGDEVIVPTVTFIATANAVSFTGATPVFVDSDYETWNIDVRGIEQAISSRTKAIIPVHLYGHPADMTPILDIAEKNKLAVIEDAAEAHGALYKGQKVGSFGDTGVFSFYGNKTITTGEGGMVVTDNDEIAEKIFILRNHGMHPKRRYWHPVLGYNYRMTNIQAALGVAQMKRIDYIVDRKRRNAALYKNKLKDISGLTMPPEATWAKNIYWLFTVLVNEEKYGISAYKLAEKLKERKIETRPVFPPVHSQPIYNTGQALGVSEELSLRGLSLPSSVNLNEDEIDRISKEIWNIRGRVRIF